MVGVERLEDVGAGAWDRVVRAAGGSVFHSHGWLRAYERAGPHRSRPLHLVGREAGDIVAVMPLYLTMGCPRLEALRRYMVHRPTSLTEPMLLAHSVFAFFGGPLVDPASSVGLDELLAAMESQAAAHGVEAFGIVNVPEDRADLCRALVARGYCLRYLSSDMVLPVSWSSFEEYLAWLPGRWRRKNVRAAMRAAEQQGVSVEIARDPGALDLLARLARRTLARHGHRELDLFPPAYLESTVADLGDRASFYVVRSRDGEPLCVVLAFEFDGSLVPWVAGLDYDQLERYEAYHCFFRAMIEHAIRSGLREIDLGRGSYRFKLRYGCTRRRLLLALSTPREELRAEVDRWSRDLEETSLGRHELHFTSGPR